MTPWTEESTAKFKATMIAKYGSYANFQKAMGEASVKAARPGTGGFASNKVGKDGLTGPARASKVARGSHLNKDNNK